MKKFTLINGKKRITAIKGRNPGLKVAGHVIEEPTTIHVMQIDTKNSNGSVTTKSTPICESEDEYREAVTDLLGS